MGWGSGSSLMCRVIDTVKCNVRTQAHREEIYFDLINAFEDYDCDTLMECTGEDKAFDKVLAEIHPDWFDDE